MNFMEEIQLVRIYIHAEYTSKYFMHIINFYTMHACIQYFVLKEE